MTFSRIQFLRTGALSLAVLIAVAHAPVLGQNASVEFELNEATADFPSGISFALRATATTQVERVELLFHAANSETLNLATPAFDSGTTVDLNYHLDLETQYLPPGVDLEYEWRLTMSNGSLVETEPSVVLWFDDRFDWEHYDSEQVTVYSYSEDTVLNIRILDSAQETVTRLEGDLDVPLSAPVRIWVYQSSADLAGAQPPNSSHIGGVTYAWLDLIAVAIASGQDSEIARIVPHEVSHHVFYQATLNPFNQAPYWLDEGLATFYQGAGQAELARDLQSAIAEDRITSIRALNSPFSFEQEAFRASYAQSWSIVGFIINEYDFEGLAALVRAFRAGVTHDEAVKTALGISVDDLDAHWKASIGYLEHGGFTSHDPPRPLTVANVIPSSNWSRQMLNAQRNSSQV